MTWEQEALCLEVDDPEIFYDVGARDDYAEARELCEACPVVDECFAAGMDSPGDAWRYGYWGDTSPEERTEHFRGVGREARVTATRRRSPEQCAHCAHPLRPSSASAEDAPGARKHQGRGLCGPCYREHREDYSPLVYSGPELLTEVGMLNLPPNETARRLGVTVNAIAKAASRHGRPDLARLYERARGHERRAAA